MNDAARASLEALIESADDYIWSVDHNFQLITFNRALQHACEIGTLLAVGMSPEQFAPPAIAESWRSLYQRALIQGSFRTEYSFANRHTLELSLNPIIVEGKTTGISVFGRDITERKAREIRLHASEQHARSVFQVSPDFVTITRLSDGIFIDANKAFFDEMGFTREEVVGRTAPELNIWANPEDRQNFLKLLRENSSCRNLEARIRRKNGEIFSGLVSSTTIGLDGVPCVVSITRDISDAKVAAETIRNLVLFDPLTGLPNRRMLLERLSQAPARRTRKSHSALLFVDLDDFRTLNDSLGHQTGDLLLQEVARRLVSSVCEADTVARLGGDEFAVLLEHLSESSGEAVAQAQTVAEKIKAAISQPFMFGARQLHKTSSIGIAIFRAGPDNANEVVQRAEIAMNQAKEVGRNTKRFFAPALQAKVNARAVLDEDLRQAIKSHQFLLYFQPQVEKNNLIGVEVLLRWAHPSRGILAPGEFIVQAEETGLILPLGDWALEASCTQIAAWGKRAEMASVPVAVNISARQFRQSNFVHQVLAALERTGANPERLVLELTEGMFVENFEDVSAKMAVLKSHGLSFSMDDFGTGYSSLAYLKKLPLDQLKIDRAFVRDVVSDVVSGAIAQTIIALGKAMTLSVIAEGVETEKQRAFLMGLGCHSFQGYLFSRPVPLNEFESWSVGRSRNQRVPNLDSETFNRKIGNGIEKGVQSTLTSSDSPALLNERRTVQRGRHR